VSKAHSYVPERQSEHAPAATALFADGSVQRLKSQRAYARHQYQRSDHELFCYGLEDLLGNPLQGVVELRITTSLELDIAGVLYQAHGEI